MRRPTYAVSIAKIIQLKFKLLQQLLYSPDLVPSDIFLFSNLKNPKTVSVIREGLFTQTDARFEELPAIRMAKKC